MLIYGLLVLFFLNACKYIINSFILHIKYINVFNNNRCGPTPFDTDYLEDPQEIHEAIKNNDLVFPDFVENQDIKDLIS